MALLQKHKQGVVSKKQVASKNRSGKGGGKGRAVRQQQPFFLPEGEEMSEQSEGDVEEKAELMTAWQAASDVSEKRNADAVPAAGGDLHQLGLSRDARQADRRLHREKQQVGLLITEH